MIIDALAPPRFTVEQFIKIGDLGVFDDRRVELRGGYLIEMPAPGPVHQTIVSSLQDLFTVAYAEHRLKIQQAIRIDDFDMPIPDLMVLKAPVRWRNIVAGDVQLLIEVAVSHPERDIDDKLPRYLRAGVPEVWIINVPLRRLEVYRSPQITPVSIVGGAEGGRLLVEPEANLPMVDVGTLFEGMPAVT